MSKLTSECQAKTIQCCSQCAVSENEIRAMIEIVKAEIIDAVKDESIGRCTDSEKEYLDDILKAIREVK